MRLTVYNGSPRARKSSTKLILDRFLAGFEETEGNTHEALWLNRVSRQQDHVRAFEEAEHVMLAFPLYTDSMPSIVKTFIESLAPLCGREANPSILFLVHSGFPEAIHCRACARYLEKLAGRLGCTLHGVIQRGSTNRIDEQPGFVSRPVFEMFETLGRGYGTTGVLDRDLVSKIAGPERFGSFQLIGMRIADALTPFTRSEWNRQLRNNGAFDRRFARPFKE